MIADPIFVGCAVALAVAGTVKGVSGIGIPMVSLSLLSFLIPISDAVALLPVPMLLANIWQSLDGRHLVPVVRRHWRLVVAMVIGTALGAQFHRSVDPSMLEALVGGFLMLFAVTTHVNPSLRLAARLEARVGALAGGIGGVLGGISSMFGPPIIMFLTSLHLGRPSEVPLVHSRRANRGVDPLRPPGRGSRGA